VQKCLIYATICCQTASFSSRWRRINNGLPQGSVLVPILFNLYMSDLPPSSLNLFQTNQAKKIHLEEGLEILGRFFHQRCLRPNLPKIEVCVFHLGTYDANKNLTTPFDNTLITHDDHPKYLGMTLDRTLSYKTHLENTEMRVNTHVNLAGTKWGSGA
jgi:hypothetical protein